MLASHKHRRIFAIMSFLAVVFVAGGCNMPRGQQPTESEAGVIYTAAARTLQARLTQVNQPPPTGNGPLFPTSTSPASTGVEGTQPVATTSAPPPATGSSDGLTPSATSPPCNQAKFIRDVTYPDNADVSPGATFVKTWRLQNVGSCAWTGDYQVIFSGGDSLGAPSSAALTSQSIPPGDTVDVSVTLQAPQSVGSYRGEFKLSDGTGHIFGLGPSDKPFWVQIDVVVASGLVYDFLVQASNAEWATGTGGAATQSLAFNGDDNDPAGAAKIKDGVRLENGMVSGKILLTYPRREDRGLISGVFPVYTVQPGDHFKARLGFITPDGRCGGGRVNYQFGYLDGGDIRLLEEWEKSCNGNLLPVDVDLSALRGEKVRFALIVKAAGAPTDDWAIWNSPLVEH